MDRRIVSGLVGLVLVGGAEACPAQSAPTRDPSAQPPVGLSPIPSIGDSINNTSLGSIPSAFARLPTSPVGSGPAATIPRAPVLNAPVGFSPIDSIHESIGRDLGTGRIGSMFRKPAARVAAPSTGSPPSMRPQAPATPASAPLFVPSTLPGPAPDLAASPAPAGRPSPFAGRSPELPRRQANPAPASTENPGAGRPAPLANEQPQTARPQAPAVDRPATATPRPRLEPANPPAFRPADSPMPAPMPAVPPTPVAPPSPSEPPAELPPAPVIEAPPVPPVATAPPPLGTDPLQGIEPVVTIATVPPLDAVPPAPAEVAAPGPIPSDPEVRRTSLDSAPDEIALKMKSPRRKELPFASLRAAAVGDQIITFNELDTAVNETIMKEFAGGKPDQMPMEQYKQIKNQIAASVLNRLIDESLILQEAKHKMQKDDKAQQRLNETIDKIWKSDELPPLLRKYACANVHELKAKLAAEGKSYEAMKEVFRKLFLSQTFLRSEISSKLSCDLSEMRAYYMAHLKDFEQPARMTWREVEINVARYPDRAAARKKAEEILSRLLHDESFEAVARAASNGPTASKGGVYVDMQPGSYGIPVVNDELNRIPVGQVSQILEAPGAFHIVRVDSRREKGPLRFDEVQDQVRAKVTEQNFHQAIETYLAKLRAKTLIRTIFDKTESDPNIVRRANDPSVGRASAH